MIPICDYQAFGPPTSKPNRNIYFISLTFTTLEGVCSSKAFPSCWLCLGSHNWSATKCLWCDLPQRKESNLQLDWIQFSKTSWSESFEMVSFHLPMNSTIMKNFIWKIVCTQKLNQILFYLTSPWEVKLTLFEK